MVQPDWGVRVFCVALWARLQKWLASWLMRETIVNILMRKSKDEFGRVFDIGAIKSSVGHALRMRRHPHMYVVDAHSKGKKGKKNLFT